MIFSPFGPGGGGVGVASLMACLLASSAAVRPAGARGVDTFEPPHDVRPETGDRKTIGVVSSGFGGSGGGGGGVACLRAFLLANSAAVRIAGALGVDSFAPHPPPNFGLSRGRGVDCDEVELLSLSPVLAGA